MIKYVAKANDDVLSHCTCESPLAAVPGQLDCPWCGCGWLICCAECGRAFVYGRIVETNDTYESLVAADYKRRGFKTITDDDIKNDAAMLAELLEPFDVGETVVYLDGLFFRLHERDLAFTGIFSKHDFGELPHAVAVREPTYLRSVLGNRTYWFDRERPDRA